MERKGGNDNYGKRDEVMNWNRENRCNIRGKNKRNRKKNRRRIKEEQGQREVNCEYM